MSNISFFFFFNDTATTEIYTLSLHDALPIFAGTESAEQPFFPPDGQWIGFFAGQQLKKISVLGGAAEVLCPNGDRSEEHTSELQSPDHLVCRLLLEKKKTLHMSRCLLRSDAI